MSLRRPFGLPWPVAAGFLLFATLIVIVVATALAPRDVAVFTPTVAPFGPAAPGAADTVTLDARSTEEWRFLDLDVGIPLAVPDTVGWDLAVRRFRVVGAREVADLGRVAFDEADRAPADGWVATEWGRDTVNAAVERWYRYGFLSHLLEPKGHVYAVRTSAGGRFRVEFLSYYCPGPEAGCVTVRFAELGAEP